MAPNMISLEVLAEAKQNTSWSIPIQFYVLWKAELALVAGAWTERKKMYHGGSFLKLVYDNVKIKNPKAQNRGLRGF